MITGVDATLVEPSDSLLSYASLFLDDVDGRDLATVLQQTCGSGACPSSQVLFELPFDEIARWLDTSCR
jgi:hypothetical protein